MENCAREQKYGKNWVLSMSAGNTDDKTQELAH